MERSAVHTRSGREGCMCLHQYLGRRRCCLDGPSRAALLRLQGGVKGGHIGAALLRARMPWGRWCLTATCDQWENGKSVRLGSSNDDVCVIPWIILGPYPKPPTFGFTPKMNIYKNEIIIIIINKMFNILQTHIYVFQNKYYYI
jgi:hypothetical protein